MPWESSLNNNFLRILPTTLYYIQDTRKPPRKNKEIEWEQYNAELPNNNILISRMGLTSKIYKFLFHTQPSRMKESWKRIWWWDVATRWALFSTQIFNKWVVISTIQTFFFMGVVGEGFVSCRVRTQWVEEWVSELGGKLEIEYAKCSQLLFRSSSLVSVILRTTNMYRYTQPLLIILMVPHIIIITLSS